MANDLAAWRSLTTEMCTVSMEYLGRTSTWSSVREIGRIFGRRRVTALFAVVHWAGNGKSLCRKGTCRDLRPERPWSLPALASGPDFLSRNSGSILGLWPFSLAQAQSTGTKVHPRGFGPGLTLPGTALLGVHANVLISAKKQQKKKSTLRSNMIYMYARMCSYMHMYVYVYICVYVCSGLSIPPQIHRVVLASRSSECDFWEVTSPVCKMVIMVTPASGGLRENG